MRILLPISLLLLGSGITPLASQNDACHSAGVAPPSRDLYCMDLIAVPEITGVTGQVALERIPGPFVPTVSPAGHLAYRLWLHLDGLPPPAAFGPYRSYVAWIATPTFDHVENLGAVGNGRTQLPAIAHNRFVILVTAEASSEVRARAGRLVLRGQSPSTRMMPPDLLEFSLGSAAHNGEHDGDVHPDSVRWTGVPMPAGLPMLPALMALRPRAAPYLPRPSGPIEPARPREVVRVATGDTITLEAGFVRRTIRGRPLVMYGFNGQYPGPLLWVPQAAQVVVIFTNHIDQPTTVHWHGLRLENASDGVPFVTQDPVPPGGTFVYRLTFPDAGIYWYHPHFREDMQQDLGLYGNISVRPDRADYYGPANREEFLMLDDILIGEAGLVPYGRDGATHTLMGRFGNVFLVNGEPDYEITAQRGEVIRFFLTNVANTRTFNLSFPGARMKVVGSDIGNFEREEWVESIVLAPAERYVAHVRFDTAGTFPLLNHVQGIDHFFGRFRTEVDTLAMVRVASSPVAADLDSAFSTLREDGRAAADIARHRPHFDRRPDKTLIVTIETDDLPYVTQRLMQVDSTYFHPVEWSGTMPMMNWASTREQVRWILRDAESGRENMDVAWRFAVGDVVKIRLHNERRTIHSMQHPIHVHGQRFLVLAVNGVRNHNLVWKDTFLLPVGATADILLELSNPGAWMIHCHIAEHIEAGMMMLMRVDQNRGGVR